MSTYPLESGERDRWILSRRGQRATVDPAKPYDFLVEEECSAAGEAVPVATVFLTNRECPWRCLMCDLWRNTSAESVPVGAIPAQIEYALSRLPAARQIKLYNSGSFFDRRAIPVDDYPAIAAAVAGFERVIVESHPALIGKDCMHFRDLIPGKLEVAMGLETANPEILDRLNKRMTLDQFASAAKTLKTNSIDLRVFILVQPPLMRPDEALHWTERSLDFAFACGATAVTLIPTRMGNGAVDALAEMGAFHPPRLEVVEAAVNYGIEQKRARVFVDLWNASSEDTTKAEICPSCHAQRVARLQEMNLRQHVLPPIPCSRCEGHS